MVSDCILFALYLIVSFLHCICCILFALYLIVSYLHCTGSGPVSHQASRSFKEHGVRARRYAISSLLDGQTRSTGGCLTVKTRSRRPSAVKSSMFLELFGQSVSSTAYAACCCKRRGRAAKASAACRAAPAQLPLPAWLLPAIRRPWQPLV